MARLRPGDHLCLIYRSSTERTATLVPFLRQGLAVGARCFYIGDRDDPELERALQAAGTSVAAERERGALVFLESCDLLPDGFDSHAMLDLLRQAEQQALDDGFSGLRVAWEECDEELAPLVEYEALLNHFLPGSRTAGLCLYRRTRRAAPLLHEVLRTHPLVVLGDQACPNAFYEAPEMVLATASPEDRISWMIAQILRARSGERKLEELSRRLAQQRAALQRADRAKEATLAMLAHELRNPLGTISNALEVLRLKGGGDETWQRAIDAAERQVHHQALLVDDVLEASRVTRGEIELHCEELDLGELVREMVEEYRAVLRDAKLRLTLALAPVRLLVRGDRRRLRQVLKNLLENAVKFTPAGGTIEVRVAPAPGGRLAEIVVRDNGVGIGAEILPHVFEVFTQADESLDRRRGGLGVGLAVVKGLVALHGGEVDVHSEGEGRGTEFAIRLPLADQAAAVEETPVLAEEDRGEVEARRILVVEDNPDAAETLRDFLELSGHEVALASTGTAGVQTARQFHPEVVLCDLGLPGMNGFEVAAALRRDPATASARLIAITGYGGDEDRRRSARAGFDLHLTKPVDPGKLRQVLQASGRH